MTKDRCYTFGAEGKLICLDLKKGKPVWTRDVRADFNVPAGFFGVGCTPILEGNLLIARSAVNRTTASSRSTREPENRLEKCRSENLGRCDDRLADGAQVSLDGHRNGGQLFLPIAATIHGRRHILCLMRQGLVSVDPADGHVNFSHWFCSRDYESVTAARPVVIDDKIFISAAYKVVSALLQVAPSGRDVTVLWRNRENMLAHWSTPIVVGGYLYGFSGRHEPEGELRCIDLKTGRVVWKMRGFDGNPEQFDADSATGEIKIPATGQVVPFPISAAGR